MAGRRVLLIEALDAAGASPADAAMRLGLLEDLGLDAEACVFDARPAELVSNEDSWSPPDHVERISDPGTLTERIEDARDRLVLVASACPGGGTLARLVPSGVNAAWWPTGIHPGASHEAGLKAIDACPEVGPAARSPASAGLCWSTTEDNTGARRRLAPWDGEYLLVPTPLVPAAGAVILNVFATVAEERDALDLVFLAPAHPKLLSEAKRLGIGPRVHFAGAAPRLAEHTWCHASSAVLVDATMPLSGGVVLRALAAGTPLFAFGSGPADLVLRSWLEQAGCGLALPGQDHAALCHALDRLLERGPQVDLAVARGRATAALHHVNVMAPRFKAAFRQDPEQRRRAA